MFVACSVLVISRVHNSKFHMVPTPSSEQISEYDIKLCSKKKVGFSVFTQSM